MARGFDLPIELITGVFNWMDIAHLIRASHVCAEWRAVARAHPGFWRDIYLRAVSTSAVEFFLARLGQTDEYGINITVDYSSDPLCDAVRSDILPAIGRNISRTVRLNLAFHFDAFPYIMSALSSPAPLLRSLLILVTSGGDGHEDVLSSDLFAQSSPLLKAVALTNVYLPAQPMPAFQRVETVAIDSNDLQLTGAFFSHFPMAKVLRAFNKTRIENTLVQSGQHVSPRLCQLDLHIVPEAYDTLPNIAAIPNVMFMSPPEHMAPIFLSHLEGPLEIECLLRMEYYLRLSVRAVTTGRTRTLGELITANWPGDVLSAQDIVGRVVTVRLHSELAHLARFDLPACRVLEVVLNEAELPNTSNAPLRLPALETVIVRLGKDHPTGGATVSEASLRIFLMQLIGPISKYPIVRLDGVAVRADGGYGALLREFEW